MTLERTRRLTQYLVLAVFLVFLYLARYPYRPEIPVDLFLRLDPLAAMTAMLAGKVFIPAMLVSAVTIVSALLLGRAFCGWFCPMGTTIDIFERIVYGRRKIRNKPQDRNYGWIKYALLVLVIMSAVFGLSLAPIIDPIPFITRIYTLAFYPVAILVGNAGLDWLRPAAARLDIGSLEYLSLFQPTFSAAILTLALFILIIYLGGFQSRFFCRNLCPLGAFLGICSRWNLWQKQVSEDCTDCTRCHMECPTGAVEHETWRDREAECIKCMICRETCPVNAITYPFGFPKKAAVPGVDLSRRRVMLAGISGAAAALAADAGAAVSQKYREIIRPPGSLPEKDFLATCVRCAECIKACPTNTLQPDGLTRGISGLWAPKHVMRLAACEQDCNVCGQVCPTGAIRDLDIEEKRYARAGTAVIDTHHCIAWGQERLSCLVCDEACPYNAIYFTGLGRRPRKPVVVESRCNGCGWCETKCPVEGQSAIVVRQKGEIRLAEGSYRNEAMKRGFDLEAPADEFMQEFEESGGGRGRSGKDKAGENESFFKDLNNESGGKGHRGGR